MSCPPTLLHPGGPTGAVLEAVPPPLIEKPRTIAQYASVSKDGRNTLCCQMGLTTEEFEDFVSVIQEGIDLFLDVSRAWTRQDQDTQKRYIDYVTSDWQHSSRYKDNWPVVAYTVKFAKLGSRRPSSPAKTVPSPAKSISTAASTLVAAERPSPPAIRRTKPAPERIRRAKSPSAKPQPPAPRAPAPQAAPTRKRKRGSVALPDADARPKKIMYVGAPPPRLMKRALNNEVPRAPRSSSASSLDLEPGAAITPFRVRTSANVASGSSARSADGEAAVRDFLSTLDPPLIDLLPRLVEHGIRDRETLMKLVTGPPKIMHSFLDRLDANLFNTVVLRRGMFQLGQSL